MKKFLILTLATIIVSCLHIILQTNDLFLSRHLFQDKRERNLKNISGMSEFTQIKPNQEDSTGISAKIKNLFRPSVIGGSRGTRLPVNSGIRAPRSIGSNHGIRTPRSIGSNHGIKGVKGSKGKPLIDLEDLSKDRIKDIKGSLFGSGINIDISNNNLSFGNEYAHTAFEENFHSTSNFEGTVNTFSSWGDHNA